MADSSDGSTQALRASGTAAANAAEIVDAQETAAAAAAERRRVTFAEAREVEATDARAFEEAQVAEQNLVPETRVSAWLDALLGMAERTAVFCLFSSFFLSSF